jgi:flavin reductase (DIM6/NTAB) family NADH-FMN oxidoreductase RutF
MKASPRRFGNCSSSPDVFETMSDNASSPRVVTEFTSSSDSADSIRFREVLGSYPTGVTVVTCLNHAGRPMGMTIGSFTSVSLDPPLVGFLPVRQSSTFRAIRATGTFCVNILASDQESICRTFASWKEDQFATIQWQTAPSGAPTLDGALAWIDCTLHSVHEVGDHFFATGRVSHMSSVQEGLPLLFHLRQYGRFATTTQASDQQIRA